VTDAKGLTKLGWMGCQGLRHVREIPTPPKLQKLVGQSFTFLPMPLLPQGGVLAWGPFPCGHGQAQIMLKTELGRNFITVFNGWQNAFLVELKISAVAY